MIIRPSSKGPDSLAITWGFQSNWFIHFEVEEKGKTPGALGLGTELYIKYANLTEPYSDLDEIFARFVDPMNDFVSLMISHRNFREGAWRKWRVISSTSFARGPRISLTVFASSPVSLAALS